MGRLELKTINFVMHHEIRSIVLPNILLIKQILLNILYHINGYCNRIINILSTYLAEEADVRSGRVYLYTNRLFSYYDIVFYRLQGSC
jgi:hypothetical protein